MLTSTFYSFFPVDTAGGVRLIAPNGLVELDGRRSPRTSPPRTLLQGILNHHPGTSPLLNSLQGVSNGLLGSHRLPPYTSGSTGDVFLCFMSERVTVHYVIARRTKMLTGSWYQTPALLSSASEKFPRQNFSS